MDITIGRVLATLREERIAGDTLVPAVMRFLVRLKAGAVSQQVTTMMDHFPTLTAACGVRSGNTLPLDGNNLWPAITGGNLQRRDNNSGTEYSFPN